MNPKLRNLVESQERHDALRETASKRHCRRIDRLANIGIFIIAAILIWMAWNAFQP